MTYLMSLQIVLAAIQIYLVWRLLAAFTVLRRFDERLGHFGEALTLLTETAETGFVTFGRELERQRAIAAQASAALATGVVPSSQAFAPAVRQAAKEDEDEADTSQVRVRVHLADRSARLRTMAAQKRQERRDGVLRG